LINKFVPSYLIPILEDAMEGLATDGYLGEYGLEIAGGAKHAGFPLGAAVLLNLIYEVEAGCTSIVAQTKEGSIIHGRNLDFNMHKILQKLAINVNFTRGGQVVYQGTTFVGYVGLLTGCKPGVFCVSIDERDVGGVWENLLEALFENSKISALLIRDMLDTATSFEQAVQTFNNTKLIAPVYMITSGVNPGEGAIITRDRNDGNVRRLGDAQEGNGAWYVLETNYDWWAKDGDGRRTAGEKQMNATGQANISLPQIFNVLSTPPVLAKGTTYTTLMSASTGYYTTTVRGTD